MSLASDHSNDQQDSTGNLHPDLVRARSRLEEGRQQFQVSHLNGTPGVQLCAQMTDLLDGIVLEIVHRVLKEATGDAKTSLNGKIALVPHGGYGRRDVAPFSDIDLMLLYRPESFELAEKIAKGLSREVVDAGLSLGFSARTPRDAVSIAMKEPEVITSLSESRYLYGSVGLYKKFVSSLSHAARRNAQRLLKGIIEKRSEERQKWGETVYLLRPNVKRSAGGLRDIQFIRWIGYIKFGVTNLRYLYERGGIYKADYTNLVNAREFLLKLRNELHFHNGRNHDLLGKNEQLRIAELLGYSDQDDKLAVELFMRDYFKHSSRIGYASRFFVESARTKSTLSSFLDPIFSRNIEGIYRAGPNKIGIHPRFVDKLDELENVLHLMKLANLHDKSIDQFTWQAIRQSMQSSTQLISPEVAENFLHLLGESKQLGRLVRQLHELGVLRKLIPGFRECRGLIQFNEYHKYTVDEHTLLALDTMTSYADDDGPLGEAYRSVERPALLHLAILMHDIGKGKPGDHSDVGAEMVQSTGVRLNMKASHIKAVRFLVQHHLKMAHLAFWRDSNDPKVVTEFVGMVGRADYLKMLYVLTCADVASVGPDVLTDWKFNLLTQLYDRAMFQLSGENPASSVKALSTQTRQEMFRQVKADASLDQLWYEETIGSIPTAALSEIEPATLLGLLHQMKGLEGNALVINFRGLEDRQAIEICVGRRHQRRSGDLYKLTGALNSLELDILAASAYSMINELGLLRFIVVDSRSNQPETLSERRIAAVTEEIENALNNPNHSGPVFKAKWDDPKPTKASEVQRQPTRVRFDNESSKDTNIIDVFAHDRKGLLYLVTRKIFDLGLDVVQCKIGTYVDQVVDVFYVQESDGGKITDRERMETIREEILRAVDEEEPS